MWDGQGRVAGRHRGGWGWTMVLISARLSVRRWRLSGMIVINRRAGVGQRRVRIVATGRFVIRWRRARVLVAVGMVARMVRVWIAFALDAGIA